MERGEIDLKDWRQLGGGVVLVAALTELFLGYGFRMLRSGFGNN